MKKLVLILTAFAAISSYASTECTLTENGEANYLTRCELNISFRSTPRCESKQLKSPNLQEKEFAYVRTFGLQQVTVEKTTCNMTAEECSSKAIAALAEIHATPCNDKSSVKKVELKYFERSSTENSFTKTHAEVFKRKSTK